MDIAQGHVQVMKGNLGHLTFFSLVLGGEGWFLPGSGGLQVKNIFVGTSFPTVRFLLGLVFTRFT